MTLLRAVQKRPQTCSGQRLRWLTGGFRNRQKKVLSAHQRKPFCQFTCLCSGLSPLFHFSQILGKLCIKQRKRKNKKQRAQVFSKWHLGSYLSVSPSCHFPRLCLSPSSANPTSCPKEKLQLQLKTLWHICYWLSLICGEEGRLTVSALSPGFLPLSPVLPSLLATRLTSPCHELLHQAPH